MPQKMKFFLDAMQLDYRTLSMLSQTSTHKSQCNINIPVKAPFL